jgi:hypothetical protein
MVKVDVEGASGRIWDGAVQTSQAIRCLVMEMLAPEVEAEEERLKMRANSDCILVYDTRYSGCHDSRNYY